MILLRVQGLLVIRSIASELADLRSCAVVTADPGAGAKQDGFEESM